MFDSLVWVLAVFSVLALQAFCLGGATSDAYRCIEGESIVVTMSRVMITTQIRFRPEYNRGSTLGVSRPDDLVD